MKKLYALIFLVLALPALAEEPCPVVDSNAKNLREIASYLTKPSKPFTRCDFNGKMVECDEYEKLKAQLVPKDEDPNLRMP